MKIQLEEAPEKEYPYLAVFNEELENFEPSEVVMVSLINEEEPKEGAEAGEMVWIQFIDGHREGWITDKESDYTPLPSGYTITITQ